MKQYSPHEHEEDYGPLPDCQALKTYETNDMNFAEASAALVETRYEWGKYLIDIVYGNMDRQLDSLKDNPFKR